MFRVRLSGFRRGRGEAGSESAGGSDPKSRSHLPGRDRLYRSLPAGSNIPEALPRLWHMDSLAKEFSVKFACARIGETRHVVLGLDEILNPND